MQNNYIIDIFRKSNALLEGHFLLTSGKHSDKYFQCAKVLQYPEYLELICGKIAEFFRKFEIDTVISPAIGGINVGQEVARQLKKRFVFAEREDKSLTLRRGFKITKNEKLLVVEDVVTTGGSVFEVLDIIKENRSISVGAGLIVDRSNGQVQFGIPQYSVVQLNVITYQPEECPLCNNNIPLVKPGSRKITK